MRKVGIIGQAQTPYKRSMKNSHLGEIIYLTVKEALNDAKIGIDEIDTVINCGCDMLDGRSISNVFTAEATGAFMKEESKVEEDGAYGLMYAWMRILTGQFDTALVVGYSKGSESSPHSYSGLISDPFFMKPLGLNALNLAALQARAYMHQFGISEEEIAKVVVKNRKNGLKNPYAQIKGEWKVEDVLNSEVLSSPVKKMDASPISDGCCVVILAEEETARKYTDKPVFILGMGQANDAFYLGHRNLTTLTSAKIAAQKAYKMAGIKNPLKEIDFAEIYEVFSYGELMLYEALSLCPEGQGGKLIDEGFTEIDGDFPVNPSGGTLCANAIIAAGLARIAECYLQLSDNGGERQIKGAKKAIAHSTSGLCFQSNLVFILGR